MNYKQFLLKSAIEEDDKLPKKHKHRLLKSLAIGTGLSIGGGLGLTAMRKAKWNPLKDYYSQMARHGFEHGLTGSAERPFPRIRNILSALAPRLSGAADYEYARMLGGQARKQGVTELWKGNPATVGTFDVSKLHSALHQNLYRGLNENPQSKLFDWVKKHSWGPDKQLNARVGGPLASGALTGLATLSPIHGLIDAVRAYPASATVQSAVSGNPALLQKTKGRFIEHGMSGKHGPLDIARFLFPESQEAVDIGKDLAKGFSYAGEFSKPFGAGSEGLINKAKQHVLSKLHPEVSWGQAAKGALIPKMASYLINSACESTLIKLAADEPIAISGGISPSKIGSGHKAPMEALYELLSKSKEIQGLGGVTKVPYDYEAESKLKHGERPIYESLKKNPLMISTGYSPAEVQETYTPGVGWGAEPPTNTMSYLLDLPASPHNVMTNYSMNPVKHSYSLRPQIGYGTSETMPNLQRLHWERFKSGAESFKDMFAHDPISALALTAKMTPRSIKELMTTRRDFPYYRVGKLPPAVSPSLMEDLHAPALSREDWEQGLYNNPDIHVAHGSLKGKPIVAISGSGRGDFVASRAYDLAFHLRKIGDKNTAIMVMTGGNPEKSQDIRKILASVPDDMKHRIHIIDRLPQKSYVQTLRGPADDPRFVHWGSSGASSSMESLLGGGKTLLPNNIWKMQGRSNELAQLHGLKGEDVALWMHPVHKGILKEWADRGLFKGNKPEDVMALMNNLGATQTYRDAATRARGEVLESQQNLVNLIYNQLKSKKERGRFMHASGTFEPATHPGVFSTSEAAKAIDRHRAIKSFLATRWRV